MRIFKEEQLLDIEYRKALIEEIEGTENIDRKQESFKRYEVFKDRVKKYVLEKLQDELDEDTVKEMEPRISNINMYKRVVGKKARVYKTAPKRETAKKRDQKQLDAMGEYLKINRTMKKVNKYYEAFLNCAAEVMPYQDALTGKWNYKVNVLPPHMYDVIEDEQNPEIPRVFIKSDFSDNKVHTATSPFERGTGQSMTNFRDGDNINQKIADSPADSDAENKEYIFWSSKYHFTCDAKGQIVSDKSPEGLLNPIGRLPYVNFAKEQDGQFWAIGGDDLIDGTVLINTMFSDMSLIAKIQGMGVFYYFGKNVPKTIKLGPSTAITHDVEDGESTPQVGFATSNPPLEKHMDMIEQYVAFLLSTNDMSTNTVQGKLSATTASSGIQELIQHSEPTGSIEDDQILFADKEPEVLEIAAAWQNLYSEKNLLDVEPSKIGKVKSVDYSIKYGAIQQFLSEKEKLENIKMRLDIGLNDMVDALILDNPDLSEDEAREKLAKLKSAVEENRSKLLEVFKNANKEKQDKLPLGPNEGPEEDKEQGPTE